MQDVTCSPVSATDQKKIQCLFCFVGKVLTSIIYGEVPKYLRKHKEDFGGQVQLLRNRSTNFFLFPKIKKKTLLRTCAGNCLRPNRQSAPHLKINTSEKDSDSSITFVDHWTGIRVRQLITLAYNIKRDAKPRYGVAFSSFRLWCVKENDLPNRRQSNDHQQSVTQLLKGVTDISFDVEYRLNRQKIYFSIFGK